MTDLVPREELPVRLEELRASGRRIVLANGCFDLLHVGHLRYLRAARRDDEVLVVALNDDASVRRLKGPGRPHTPLAERAELLAALEPVDFVTCFGEDTLDVTLRTIVPDVHAKGTDYSADTLPEAATDAELGIELRFCGDHKTHSSRERLDRLERGS
ncbi:Bifunctional protein HldE [Planctomycetes bacterium Pla163]|uniref:Bifunctional protein HldE n=1 Tax=Rohdeia mirabilis TaxID=2528008 RepID=A0A518D344_9BACT|nr:Bifunctional protein HldE [Planctomycetes bacterium Pla163]